MADGTTANYSWKKPENGASSDTWGTKWNENADDIDADLKAVEDQIPQNDEATVATPVVDQWYSTTITILEAAAPQVWLLTASQPTGANYGSWIIGSENGNGNAYTVTNVATGMAMRQSGTAIQIKSTSSTEEITYRWTKLVG